MAAANEYSCLIWLHVLIDYRNVLIVNFARGQKVVGDGWLLSADRPEISVSIQGLHKHFVYETFLINTRWNYQGRIQDLIRGAPRS